MYFFMVLIIETKVSCVLDKLTYIPQSCFEISFTMFKKPIYFLLKFCLDF